MRSGPGPFGREAKWMVEEASGLTWAEWREPATERGAARLTGMLGRRLAGEPLQYVLGHWPFRDLDLVVDPRVLIPRPETEVVAEVAIAEAVWAGARWGAPEPGRSDETSFCVADLGTGSGALALTLAAELPEAEVWATDKEEAALAVASANLAAIGPAAIRVHLAGGVWYEALPDDHRGRFRVIVSNPPYVSEAEYSRLPSEVRDHEPRTALVPGPAGTEALEHLLDGALGWLEPGGALVLELAPHQAEPLRERVLTHSGWSAATVHLDLAGRPRVLAARKEP